MSVIYIPKDIRLDDVTFAEMEMLRCAALAQMPKHDKGNDYKPSRVFVLFDKKCSRGDAR